MVISILEFNGCIEKPMCVLLLSFPFDLIYLTDPDNLHSQDYQVTVGLKSVFVICVDL